VVFTAGGMRWRIRPEQLGVHADWGAAVEVARRRGDGFGPLRGFRRVGVRVFGAAKPVEFDGNPKAQATLGMVPEAERKGAAYDSAAAALKLLLEAGDLSEADELEAKLAANPDDHQTRFDLAVVRNAEGKRVEAAEALVALMKLDRTWNDDGARKKLLELFEAWGPKDPATIKGRRLLSAVLFS
jgi:putative thioredoxin